MDNQLELVQSELEDLASARGMKAFMRQLQAARQRGQETHSGAVRKILQDNVELMIPAIEAWVEVQEGSRGRRHSALRWVKSLGYEVAAYLTVKNILDQVSTGEKVTAIASEIGKAVGRELRARRLQELAPQLFEYKLKTFDRNSSYAHQARSMDAAVKHGSCSACFKEGLECDHLDMEDLVPSYKMSVLIGMALVNLFVEVCGVVEVETKRSGPKKSAVYLKGLPAVLEWIEARNTYLGGCVNHPLPMVVPPIPWGPGVVGGYRYALRAQYPLVRTGTSHLKSVGEAQIPKVYGALNRIQETPWRINRKVLEIMEEVAARGGAMAGIPQMVPDDLPARPEDIDTNDEARKAWRIAAAQVHNRNSQLLGEVRTVTEALWASNLLVEREALWFPHSLDFRGRVYPIPSVLSPQGRDLHRGLLEFADGKPIGETGLFWLSVHGANCLGEYEGTKVGTLTLDERVAMIEALEEDIRAVGENPWGNRWWMDAEEPAQFLAFCFDYSGYMAEGLEYVSHLPVHMDGSNNGLQHLSAMLRDPVGGAAVNITANSTPRDVYQEVADKVLDIMQGDAAKGDNPVAEKWLASGLITRKLCKRPVMTYPYGSKTYGFMSQTFDWLRTEGHYEKFFEDFRGEQDGKSWEPKNAVSYAAQCIWLGLQGTVVAASQTMQWLQSAASLIAKQNKIVKWEVPDTDFPVWQTGQTYFLMDRKRVDTILNGSLFRASYRQTTGEVSLHRQVNGLSPNFVHSLDAAVLMLTVLNGAGDGIEHFAMIHDSYGTLAADAELLNRVTRETFYRYYQKQDVLEYLYFQLLDQLDDAASLEGPPPVGDLDLAEVLSSDYFFC